MAKVLAFVTTASLLVSLSLAVDCPANVTAAATAVVNNVTNLNTCASGSTWQLTNLFQLANLSTPEYRAFCNSTACVGPMQAVLDAGIPDRCSATINGMSIALGETIKVIDLRCRQLLQNSTQDDQAEKPSDAVSNVPTPAPTNAATTVSPSSLAVAIAGASAIAAIVL